MRFTLVDRIVSLERGESISTVKNLSLAEEYLADHFPGFPVLPGVLMLEALIQTGAWLMRDSENFRYSTILLKQAKALKFNSFVTPGQTLCVTANVHSVEDREWTFKAKGTVDDASAVSARITLQQFNLADQDPSLADSDQRTIEHMKSLFGELWRPDTVPEPDADMAQGNTP
ncbi:MAG: 3-hydroxyacyl-ACP dehydratase FabZ family protein [Planctomycetaceae bacterium]